MKHTIRIEFCSKVCQIFFLVLLSRIFIGVRIRKMDLQEYLELGKEFNLEGSKLLEFAREMQKDAREERQRNREHEKIIKDYELNIAKARENWTVGDTVTSSRPKEMLPKLPPFQDGKDDMDSYLKRFERYARSMDWEQSDWAVPLGALLTGKALEVYTRMPDEESSDYSKLKDALLHRFQLNEDGFRQKFRRAKLEQGETYSQFADRLKGYLTRWVEMGAKAKTYNDLVDLMIREQINNVCQRDLGLFLRERNPRNVSEMVKLADRYQNAHSRSNNPNDRCWSERVRHSNSQANRQQAKNGTSNRDGRESFSSRLTCYNCQGKGHVSRNCPMPRNDEAAKRNSSAKLCLAVAMGDI